ncbi:MAG: M28 family peptidase [Anaerolineae bacterium]|nr:M28 family peptidase [Anaerolineae bacterium]
MEHVRNLADVIGARPAGERGELLARQYVRHALTDGGVDLPVEEIPFKTPNTWGYALLLPLLLALAGNLLPKRWRWLGGLMALSGGYAMFRATTGQRQPLTFLAPSGDSGNLIVKIPAKGKTKQRVVLVGHLDTNKHRPSFTASPEGREILRPVATAAIIATVLNGLAQLFDLTWLRRLTALTLAVAVQRGLADETGDFVAGANDNATAVACLLGLGAHLQQQSLANTEVWLAFTGAEEVGCIGMQKLLDTYRVELAHAWFIDFEMVGAGKIAYVTEHSSFSHFGAYRPDDESLALAVETARQHPELQVTGTPMMMVEEVGTLRSQGFRGICLVGVGEDGWLVNWHQASDTAANIDPTCIETAARFGLAMLQTLDERK